MAAGLQSSCPGDEALAAFACGNLDASSFAALEAHLAECEDCARVLAAVVAAVAPPGEEEQPEQLRIGHVLAGKYRIEGRLGEGGMGVVLAAKHVDLGHRVAIKVLTSSEPSAAARFLREGKASSRLANEHIARVFDLGRLRGGVPYLVMEYLEGEDLARVIARGRLPVCTALDYLLQACAALEPAHEAGVVHRDLKPSNLFVTRHADGSAWLKLIDFGIAKFSARGPLDITGNLTLPEALLGSPLYMSPEQLRCEPSVDARSDIWSLGVILYELLTGSQPFDARHMSALMVAILTQVPRPPSALVPGLAAELDRIVLRCLEKEPGARYGTIWELRMALQEALSTLRVTAPVASSTRARVNEKEPAPRALHRAEQSTLDGFVGRELELRRVRDALEQAQRGAGRVLLLSGEAGIGKTTLARRALQLAAALPVPPLCGSGRCFEHSGASEPYLPFLEAIAAWLEGPDRELVRRLLRLHAPTWCLQFAGAFGADQTREELRRETRGADRERMLRELGDALAALSNERCVVLLLEDLHWADASSIDQLRLLSQRSAEQRWLLIATFRAEGLRGSNPALAGLRADFAVAPQCRELGLSGWSAEQVEAYVGRRLPAHALPVSFCESLTLRTEGQPLFVSGLLDLLVERGDIVESDAGWRLTRPASDVVLEVPASVSSVIGRKLEALSEPERRVLQYASVEGAEFTSGVIAELLNESQMELEERLERVEAAHGLIVALKEEQLSPGRFSTRYCFAHVLYQDHLYAELTGARRRDLHLRVAQALLRQHGEDAAPAAALAFHFERAEDVENASRHLLRAAEAAERAFAYQVAVELCSRATELLARFEPSRRPAHYARLNEKLGWVRFEIRLFEEAAAAFRELLLHCEASGDVEGQIEALVGLCFCGLSARRFDATGQLIERGLGLAVANDKPARRSELLALQAVRAANLSQFESAERALDEGLVIARRLNHARALELAEDCRAFLYLQQYDYARTEAACAAVLQLDLHPRVVISNTYRRGVALGKLGRISEAILAITSAQDLARRKSQTHSLLTYPIALGDIHREIGSFELAIALHGDVWQRSAEERARTGQDPTVRRAPFRALVHLGYDYLAAGRMAEARETVALAAQGVSELNTEASEPAEARFDLALLQLELQLLEQPGEPARASQLQQARSLLAQAGELAWRDDQVGAYLVLARLELSSGRTGETRRALGAALELLAAYPMPLRAWRAHAMLGEVLEVEGDLEAAAASRRAGSALLRRIAENIDDVALRRGFLEWQPVRLLLSRTG